MTPKFTSYHAKTIVIALLLFIDVPLLYSQSAGVPDSSFGKNGIVLTKVAAGRDDISESIAVTPDHKMVVAGNSNSVHAGSQNSIAVTQYLLNGKPDKTFNTTGTVIIMNAYAGAVAVQPDNKIVAGGIITNGSTSVFAVWRLNKNGTTDSVFGTGGYQKIPFFKGNATCYAVTLQPDGKILVGGNSAAYLAVARLKANGTPDAGFGTAGKFVQTVDTGSLVCRAIVVQPDGNIIIAGQYDSIYSRDETSSYMFALRLSSRGLPDASFGANGRREYRGASSNADYCYSAARLPESRIVIAGMSSVSSGAQPAGIVCVKSNGDVDASFGLNGWQYIDFGSTIYTGADAAVIQSDGKIILAGNTSLSQNVPSLFLGRLNTNESFDAAFANNGKSTYFSSPGAFIGCNAAALQADGKILVTGSKIVASNNYLSSYLTARFLNAQAVTIASVNKIAQPAIQSVIGAGISPNPVVNNLIRLTIPVLRSAQITISVYDASGNVITAPYAKEMSAGLHTEAIQLPPFLANGICHCVIRTSTETNTINFMVAN